MIKILVADDHPIIRRGVKQILSETTDLTVSDEASNGLEALDKIRHGDFDLVLLDLSMPGISGMEVLKQIKKEKPALPVIILSRYPEEQYAIPAIKAGAAGYVSKTSITDDLIVALRRVAGGKKYISNEVAEELLNQVKPQNIKPDYEQLSDREREILGLIASGKKISTIAHDLSLSQTTVSTYKSRIMKKLHMETMAELVRYAVENGLVE